MNTKVVDDVIDEMLSQLGKLQSIQCTVSDSCLLLHSNKRQVAEICLPRAKTILRLICARLAVRAAEWASREVSPYGDSVECESPLLGQPFKIGFENTPSAQWFEISAKRKTKPRSSRRYAKSE